MFQEAARYASQEWFPWLVALLHALDTFILVVPNDFLIAAAVYARPKDWLWCAIVQTGGCGLGCVLFSLLAYYNPQGIKDSYPSVFESQSWEQTEGFYRKYGAAAALFGAAVMPIHPFLFIGALSGMSAFTLIGAICMGRLVRNIIVCYTAARATNIKID